MNITVDAKNFHFFEKRMILEDNIQDFFRKHHYRQVYTPLMAPFLIPESSIEVFSTEWFSDRCDEPLPLYLLPSPELYMKLLLACGSGSIFQLSRSFRNGDRQGPYHHAEFTMLEWYTVDHSYLDSLKRCQELLRHLAPLAHPSLQEYLLKPGKIVLLRDVFEEYTGLALEECQDWISLSTSARQKGWGTLVEKSQTWEELFHFLFVSLVEPQLDSSQEALYLLNYPRALATTAAPLDEVYSQRWEVYLKGLELANCFTENRDPTLMRALFIEEGKLKETARVPHKIALDYPDILASMPANSGVALGFDRLFALLQGASSFEEVTALRFDAIISKREEIQLIKESL